MTLPSISHLFSKPAQFTLDYNDVVSFATPAARLVSGSIWGFRQMSDGRLGVRVRVANEAAWFVKDYMIDSREIVRVERDGFAVFNAAQAA